MVDIDNLIGISNSGTYPNLFNSTDVEAVKSIMEIYPELFPLTLIVGVDYIKVSLLQLSMDLSLKCPLGLVNINTLMVQ